MNDKLGLCSKGVEINSTSSASFGTTKSASWLSVIMYKCNLFSDWYQNMPICSIIRTQFPSEGVKTLFFDEVAGMLKNLVWGQDYYSK